MGPLIEPKIFQGDGVIFMSSPDWKEQGPHQIRWGLWIPLFECNNKKKDDLLIYLKKHYPRVYEELLNQVS